MCNHAQIQVPSQVIQLGRGPPRRSQDREEEVQEQQQRQGVAVRRRQRGAGGLGRQAAQLDETEIGSGIHHPEASDYTHNTGDEDDEDPRPAKR